jgi:predicted nucleic acid-binding Zn ribbon protein
VATYVYRDPDDGETFDFDFPMGEAPDQVEIEEVNGAKNVYKRVFTAPGVVFKGSGWASKS